MNRTAILVILTLVSCGKGPPEKTPAERGAAVFTPAVDRLGEAIAVELKEQSEKAYKQYLQETSSKNEAELGRALAAKMLPQCLPHLHLTVEQEAEIKAGRFKDHDNLRRINAAVVRMTETKEPVSEVTRTILLKVKSGEWSAGLMLEFAVRMVEGHFTLPHDHKH